MIRILLTAVLAALPVPGAALASEKEHDFAQTWEEARKATEEREENLALFNDCFPIVYFPTIILDGEEATGLTAQAVNTAIKTKLKAAGLHISQDMVCDRHQTSVEAGEIDPCRLEYFLKVATNLENIDISDSEPPHVDLANRLDAMVLMEGDSFAVQLQFKKWFGDYATPIRKRFTTWESEEVTGRHRGEADYVLYSVSQQMDKFLTEYFRVNDEACEAN